MPAQTNATITQNMSDRQPDIDIIILSMIFIFLLVKSKEMQLHLLTFCLKTVYFSLSTVKYEVETETPFISMPN